jgi:hypothetical protein
LFGVRGDCHSAPCSPYFITLRRDKVITLSLSFLLEAATGFEPVNNGFADRRLTTWLCRPLERETGFEPATSTLARLHSTAELFPHFCSENNVTVPARCSASARKRVRAPCPKRNGLFSSSLVTTRSSWITVKLQDSSFDVNRQSSRLTR